MWWIRPTIVILDLAVTRVSVREVTPTTTVGGVGMLECWRGNVESGLRNTSATRFRAAEPGNTPRQGRIGMLKQIGAYESPKTASLNQ